MNIVLSYFGKLILDSSPLREGRTENRTLYYTEQERKEGREASLAVFYFGNLAAAGGRGGEKQSKNHVPCLFRGRDGIFFLQRKLSIAAAPDIVGRYEKKLSWAAIKR